MGRMWTERVLADFVGDWQIDRHIAPDGGPRARFEGQATWRWEQEGLGYAESGQLQIAGQGQFQAERRYQWRAPLDVYFEDGRFFHHVRCDGQESQHLCGADDYRVTYDFAQWPQFEAVWQVRGPRKAYRMVTRFQRL